MVALYWLGILVTVPFWLFVFLRLRSERRNLIVGGLIAIPIGVIWDTLMWQQDWWLPGGITPYNILESAVYTFLLFGFSALCYEAVSGKPMAHKGWRYKELFILVGVMTVAGPVLFYTTGTHTFVLTTLIGLAFTTYLLFRKPQMTYPVFASGAIVLLYGLVSFPIAELFAPGFLGDWQMARLSGVVFLSAPLEDLIFYFVWGALLAAMYRFVRSD